MTYTFYTIALLLIAFPGYWSEKGDGKYCLKSPEINHISYTSHQNLLHLFSTSIISSLSFGSFGLIQFPYTLQTFLESCGMKLPFSYLGTLINIGVFFLLLMFLPLVFLVIDWSVAEMSFQKFAHRSSCAGNPEHTVWFPFIISTYKWHYWANNYCLKLSCPQDKLLSGEIAIFSSISTGWMLLSGVPTNSMCHL